MGGEVEWGDKGVELTTFYGGSAVNLATALEKILLLTDVPKPCHIFVQVRYKLWEHADHCSI